MRLRTKESVGARAALFVGLIVVSCWCASPPYAAAVSTLDIEPTIQIEQRVTDNISRGETTNSVEQPPPQAETPSHAVETSQTHVWLGSPLCGPFPSRSLLLVAPKSDPPSILF
jgi:hypothetical protein